MTDTPTEPQRETVHPRAPTRCAALWMSWSISDNVVVRKLIAGRPGSAYSSPCEAFEHKVRDAWKQLVLASWFHDMAGERHPELREGLERSRGNAVATFLIEKGHDPLVVQRMLRHSHVDMTMHYTHNSHKRRAAQADFTQRFLPVGEAGAKAGARAVVVKLKRIGKSCGSMYLRAM